MSERLKPGSVRDAIIETLTGARGGKSIYEIHEAVSQRLGTDVPKSSVRSYLNLNTRNGKFERVGRGKYKLKR